MKENGGGAQLEHGGWGGGWKVKKKKKKKRGEGWGDPIPWLEESFEPLSVKNYTFIYN